MSDLTKLSAAKLNALYDKRFEETRLIGKALIQAGYGMETGQATRKRAAETGDPLAVRWCEINDAFAAVVAERSARRRWHGSDKPIRRRA